MDEYENDADFAYRNGEYDHEIDEEETKMNTTDEQIKADIKILEVKIGRSLTVIEGTIFDIAFRHGCVYVREQSIDIIKKL